MEQSETVVAGRNAVAELLKSDRAVDTLYVEQSDASPALRRLASAARKKGAVIKFVNAAKLRELADGVNPQGVVCITAAAAYATLEQLFAVAAQKQQPPFFILADEIEDPHNLGALIRTAEAAGAHGVILPKRRSASLTATVYKTSAGALNHMPVARVSNLPDTMEKLKKQGVWLYAADMDGEPYCTLDYTGAVGLVVGSEGRGVTRLVKEKCDFTVRLPMCGQVSSLNASVAGGIIMYEICRQRNGLRAYNKG